VRYGKGPKYIDIQLPCRSAIDLFFDIGQQVDALDAVDTARASRLRAHLQIAVTAEELDCEWTVSRRYTPRRRLSVAGVGPAAVQLCRLGLVSGFEVEMVSGDDLTREFAGGSGVRVHDFSDPRKPPELRLDQWTAIVFMFHDHDMEREIIPAALATDAFYVGALGSRKTHRQRVESLQTRGFGYVHEF
jgi:xanthine dehydrogenase accessory factor